MCTDLRGLNEVLFRKEKKKKKSKQSWKHFSHDLVDTLPDDASLGVLFPLVKGIGEVEEASGGTEGRTARHGPQERRHPGHQNPTR